MSNKLDLFEAACSVLLRAHKGSLQWHMLSYWGKIYRDQPFVSETMRCESVDFIQTIDDKDKNICAFMCEG